MLVNYRLYWLAFVGLITLFGTTESFSQCPTFASAKYNSTANKFCAPASYDVEYGITFITAVTAGHEVRARFDWGDGTFDLVNFATADGLTTTFLAPIQSHVFPGSGGPCEYMVSFTIEIDDGSGFITCPGTAQQDEFASWETDDINGGNIELIGQISGTNEERVCYGVDVDVLFDNTSTFNCQVTVVGPPTVPKIPNVEARWEQFVYNTSAIANKIPNLSVDGVLVTDPAGADIFFNYQDTRGVVMIPANATDASLKRTTLPITAPGGFGPAFPQVGDQIEITLRMWNFCNPYSNNYDMTPVNGDFINGDNAPLESTAYVTILDAPADPIPNFNKVCNGDVLPDFSFTVPAPGLHSSVDWYRNDGGVPGIAIINSNGLNSTSLDTDDFMPGGAISNLAPGTYTVWASYNANPSGLVTCQSDKMPIDLVITEPLAVPGGITGSNQVCNNTILPYNVPANAGTQPLGGDEEFVWSVAGGGGVTVTPSITTNMTVSVDFSLAAGFGTATRTLQVFRRYQNAPQCPTAPSTMVVTIYEETFGGTIAGNQSICDGAVTGNIVLSTQVGAVINWERSFAAGSFAVIPGKAGMTTITDTPPNGPGNYDYRAIVQNGPCLVEFSTNTIQVVVNPNPNDITADVTVVTPNVCQGGNTNITVDNTQNDVDYALMDGATQIGASQTGNGGLLIFNTGALAATTNFDITATKNAGTGCQITMGPFPVDVTPTLVPSVDMGPDQVICTGGIPDPITGSDPTGGNGVGYTYQWQIASAIGGPFTNMVNGAIPEGVPTDVTASTLVFNGTIADQYFRRLEFSGACSGVSNIVSVLVSSTIPLDGTITTGPTNLCEGSTNVTYAITGANGASPNLYEWTIPAPAVNTATGTSGTFTKQTESINIDFPADASGIIISVLANNGCGPAVSSAAITVNSNPSPEVLINQTKTICSGEQVDLEVLLNPANLPAGTLFDWPVPVMSDASVQGSAGVAVNADPSGTFHLTDMLVNTTGAPITATYTITPTGPLPNSCPGLPRGVIISVSPVPVILPGQVKTVCAGEAVDFKVDLSPNGMPPGTTYDWPVPIMSDGSGQGTSGTSIPESNALTITDVFINTTANPITATYSITPTGPAGTNCMGVTEDVVITINPTPEITAQPIDDLKCETLSTTFSVGVTGPLVAFKWQRSTDGGTSYQPVIEGVGSSGEVYSDSETADLTIDNLASAMNGYMFKLEITSTAAGACSIESSEVLLTVSPDATVPTDPVGTVFRCQVAGSDAYTTTSNFAIQGYNWSVAPAGAGSFRDGGSGEGIALTDNESITWASDFFGTAEIYVEAVGCSSNPVPSMNPISVEVHPATTTTEISGGNQIVAGTDAVCVGSTYYYVVDPPGGDIGSSYTWSLTPLDGNEPLLSDFGNLIGLDFTTAPWAGTLEVVEINNTCPGPTVTLDITSFSDVVADAGPDASVCEGQLVQIGTPTATGGSGDFIYAWSPVLGLDDPTIPQPVASPPLGVSPITYSLTVTDANTDCPVGTDEVVITVDASPSLSISPSADEGCSPLLVNFDNSSQGVFSNKWFWRVKGTTDENDVLTSYLASYEFSNTTLDDVVYEVVYQGSSGFCTSETITEITVSPELIADFTVSPGNIVTLDNSTITVTNNTVDKIEWEHLWDFGDGTTSTEIDPPPHTYAAFGDYDLTLTITDPDSQCESIQLEPIKVQAVLPEVDFEVDVTEGCRPLTVNFTNLSISVDPDSYEWEFRNNFGEVVATSKEEHPTVTFYDAGIINVTLSGTNPLGVTDSKTELELIEVYDMPTASFVVRPTTVFLPDQLLFTSNLSMMADEFMWDFDGDGGIESEEFEPSHKYNVEGVYNVSLIAINSQSTCKDTLTIEKAVKVIEAGMANVPNGFFPVSGTGSGGGSPGGPDGSPSGSNTVFLPRIQGVRDDGFIMQIFDRWGHLLYESRDKTIGWNGSDQNGKLYPSGVYVYKLELVYVSGEHSNIVGDVTLIR